MGAARLTYRIRGIPTSWNARSLQTHLAQLLHQRGGGDEQIFVKSLSTAARLDSQVATVELGLAISLPPNLPNNEWTLSEEKHGIGSSDQVTKVLTVDSHFRGLTPLHTAYTAQTAGSNLERTNIVAVSGLGSHAFGSFKEQGGTYMWLRDALPSRIPTANIWIYGFDSTVANSTSVQNIDDIASRLVSSLREIAHAADECEEPGQKSPRLIMIGHSLGGLVIKQALIRLDDGPKVDSDISKALCSLLLFGVPNQGMAIQSLLAMCGGGPNEGLIRTLGPNSEVIRTQRKKFAQCAAVKGCEIHCFYETKLSPTAVKNDQGKWEITGPNEYLVTSESAAHHVEGVTSINNLYAINTSHSELVKFRAHDEYSENVFRILVDDSSKAIAEDGAILKEQAVKSIYNHGFSLHDAPIIDDSLFFGRDKELESMNSFLASPQRFLDRRVLVLGGTGGVGKTQIALRYAQRHQKLFSSVFWLDATSEFSLMGSLRKVAPRILGNQNCDQLKDQELWMKVSFWLSETENNAWLIIYDNYDDPGQYQIHKYWPAQAHGSIIITTRQPDEVRGYPIRIKPLSNLEEGLQILATRSGRLNAPTDPGARELALRLDGFPLALATAGTFLGQSAISFSKYLEQYEKKWQITRGPQRELPDYQTRTLYTTWDLSLAQIERQMPQAARLLAFIAFFDHQDIWYNLLRAEDNSEHPDWFREMSADEFLFEEMMATLVRFCLVECHPQKGSYSLHACVHDWTFYRLNTEIDPGLYRLAFCCLTQSYVWQEDITSWKENRRLYPHLQRLLRGALRDFLEQNPELVEEFDCYHTAGELYRDQCKLELSEQMYTRALQGYEKALGPDHISTLNTVYNLGLLYRDQGKLETAEQMLLRALQGKEKALGPDHTSTLDIVSNLGVLYHNQGKLETAEQMLLRALQGNEKALGPDHTSTLDMVDNLGLLYRDQGKLETAEQMLLRALQGKEKALGPDHTSTLDMVNNLGLLYHDQGKLETAEQMYTRALQGKEKALGPDHTSTLDIVNNLGLLYRDQGKLETAEQMLLRALQGKEKVLGPDHISTFNTVYNLGLLYRDQGKLELAEQMYTRALQGYEKALGPDHTSTLDTVNNLGAVYLQQIRPASVKSCLEVPKLLSLLTGYLKSQPYLFSVLGRALVKGQDDSSARESFYHQCQITKSLWNSILCDGCNSSPTHQNLRYICKSCPETDLCEVCYEKHSLRANFVASCNSHTFLKLYVPSVSTPASPPQISGTQLIERLAKCYEADRDLKKICDGIQAL